MEKVNQQPPGGQQSFPQTNQQEKQLMTILGVQGLSYQNYSVVELKIVLQIIKHAQKAILEYRGKDIPTSTSPLPMWASCS